MTPPNVSHQGAPYEVPAAEGPAPPLPGLTLKKALGEVFFVDKTKRRNAMDLVKNKEAFCKNLDLAFANSWILARVN